MASADKPVIPALSSLPEEATPTPGGIRGVEVIRAQLKGLPAKPGVYRMIGADGEVLYVGKAKSLRARVSQYAQGRGHTNRITRMIALVCAMDFIVTATETEALLLETNMIKRLRPRFNVLMRDDKSFAMIALREDHPSPALQKHRGAKTFKGRYFGPFASTSAVNRTLNTLQKAFLLRSCTDSVFNARTRPCMLYQIKRCAAPCVDLISPEDYQRLVDDAATFLNGKSVALQDQLAADMAEAAEALEFERAARLRNRIRALAAIRAVQGINPQTFDEADLFAIHYDRGSSCIQVFFFRAGQNWGNRAYFPRHEADLGPQEVLEAFLAQFYDERDPPGLVLTSVELPGAELLEQAFSLKTDRRIQLHTPQRGEKREIMDQALLNAREALARRMAESDSVGRHLDDVARLFGLPQPPERIEVYDNSHIQGTNAVGAMIVAGPDGFDKGQYRKFNMKEPGLAGDDFAMMRAMLKRRFARLIKDTTPKSEVDAKNSGVDFSKDDGDTPVWPDLMLIDGGEGQLKVALDALEEAGLSGRIAIVGIAKGVDRDAGRERFFMPGKPPFRVEENTPVLYYLQRLRDEAHRFAIGAHRQKRSADIAKNPLDEIDGIGPRRKKALLTRFGSARGVARAAVAELEEVEGVNAALAQRIHAHFNDKR